jgi:hypothetical protein
LSRHTRPARRSRCSGAALDIIASDPTGRCRVRTPRLAVAANGAGDLFAALFFFHYLRALDDLALGYAPYDWPFAAARRDEIAAHFAKSRKSATAMWNGRDRRRDPARHIFPDRLRRRLPNSGRSGNSQFGEVGRELLRQHSV